jgi:glucose/arabinose dehydrogenase
VLALVPSLAAAVQGERLRSGDAHGLPAVLPAGGPPRVVLGEPVLSAFDRPVLFIPRGARHASGFVVEQTGRVQNTSYDLATGTWARNGTFLDIHTLVSDPSIEGEQGLLGMALPPDYATSGRFYVYYTAAADGANTVAEYRRQSKTVADPGSRRIVLQIPDHFPNHNGGMLLFRDQYLYIATGDGGAGGDPENRAQSLSSRLGKILRIDPRNPDGKGPKTYRIPRDNPFVGMRGVKKEIWAYGLRNPWRFSIDPPTGDLWIGDVGQCLREEVDHAGDGRGVNFGWRKLEGRTAYNTADPCTPQPDCLSDCETLPVADYTHADGCAVTGGHVYRGTDNPAWRGWYLYGDFCTGRMWIIPASGPPGVPVDVTPQDRTINISSFARDNRGELFAIDLGGSLYQLHLSGSP